MPVTSRASCTKRLPRRRSSRRTGTSHRRCSSTVRGSPTRPTSSSRATTTSRACSPPPARRSPSWASTRHDRPSRATSGACSRRTGTVFAGTASGYWLTDELAELFGITEELDAENADRLYDLRRRAPRRPRLHAARAVLPLRHRGARHHRRPAGRPSSSHALLAADPGFDGRVAPDLPARRLPRPRGRRVRRPRQAALAAPTGRPTSFGGYLAALEDRRRAFHRPRRRLRRPRRRSSRSRPTLGPARGGSACSAPALDGDALAAPRLGCSAATCSGRRLA